MVSIKSKISIPSSYQGGMGSCYAMEQWDTLQDPPQEDVPVSQKMVELAPETTREVAARVNPGRVLHNEGGEG